MERSVREVGVGAMFDRYRSALNERFGTNEARAIGRAVFQEYLGWDIAQLEDHRADLLEDPTLERFESSLARLRVGEPLQYVLGHAWFMGLRLHVGPAVLIPRPETEELVQRIMDQGRSFPRILDLGTGSGCIAIAIKMKWPASHVVGVDVSAEALDIARKNSDALGAQVEWRKCDVLASGTVFHGPFDLIVSNPPYVPRSDAFAMPKHVIDHEPHGALFVEDADPLVFYRAIADHASRALSRGGLLWFEAHYQHAKAVADLLLDLGYRDVRVEKDLSGADRFIRAER